MNSKSKDLGYGSQESNDNTDIENDRQDDVIMN